MFLEIVDVKGECGGWGEVGEKGYWGVWQHALPRMLDIHEFCRYINLELKSLQTKITNRLSLVPGTFQHSSFYSKAY